MLDFNITFLSSTSFEFTDNSTYIGLTVSATELRIYGTPITNETYDTILLYGGPILILGEDYTVDLEVALEDFLVLEDDIYRFDYVVTSVENGVEILTKYFAKTLDLLKCRRTIIRNVVNYKEDCLACEANFFDSVLYSIDIETASGNYKEAELLIAHLKDICKQCDC
jgi:hypothetical protein